MSVIDKKLLLEELGKRVGEIVPSGETGRILAAAKPKISSASRQKLNHKASWQKLEALLATNFDAGDLFVTLTYRDSCLPPTREAAGRCLAKFLQHLRTQRTARGEELLYVKNTEHMTEQGEAGRWHHHLAINATGSDYDEILSLWSRYGDNVDFEYLLGEGEDYASRARYLCKERPPAGKQDWTPSRGLRRPRAGGRGGTRDE